MRKHTPGPWDYWSGYNPVDELEAQITTEDGDIVIASYNRQIPEGEANARLLAAAPELLEALQDLDALRGPFPPSDEAVEAAWLKATAAIAKATA
ncbi:hypothetical protein ACM7KX_29895 [Pseudomonas aeruginosa]